MNLSHGSSGTTALTNALKQVFYIHKDVVAELKTKLDTLSHENDRLKKDLLKVSPRRSDKCESCAHLRELNTTLQENFNSRLKDKNAIIKHLERRLRAAGAGDDGSCTSYTEDVSVRAEMNGAGIENTSSLSFQNPNDILESQTDGPSKDVPCDMGDDLYLGRLQNKRLRLMRDGRKRSRYVEEAPDAKRQKTSPTQMSQTNRVTDGISSGTDKSVTLEANSPLKETMKDITEKKLNETILAAETEYTLPVDKQANSSAAQAINKKNTKIQGFSSGDVCHNLKSPDLIIPETLGLDVHSGDNESETDDNAVSSVLQLSSQPDENLDIETNDLMNEIGEVLTCIDDKNVPLENKTPEVSISRTEITPTRLSPGIFDDIRKKKSDSDTPKSSQPVCHGEIHLNGAFAENQKLLKHMSEKNILMSSPGSAPNRRLLRQATLSQSFKNNHSPGTKGKSMDSMKCSEAYNDEVELRKAIQASLEESSVSKNKIVESSGFKVPLSPEQLRASRSPRQKHLNEKENNVTAGSKTSPRSAMPAKETRRSPRLAKLVKTHSDPLMGKEIDNARKNLFREACSPQKKTSQFLNEEKPVNHTSQEQKEKLAVIKNQSKNSSHVSENCLNEYVSKNESQRTCKDSPLNAVPKNTESKDTQDSLYKQRKRLDKACGLNGSLNPDVQLSMYLESQKTCVESELNTMVELDETVAPNLLSESKVLMTSKEAMKELECLNTEETTQGAEAEIENTLIEDASDSEETIAPSPVSSSVMSDDSQSQSMPCASIPSSSRSFKFKSKPRGKSFTDAHDTDLKKLHGKTLLDGQSCDGMEMPMKYEERVKNKHNLCPVSPKKRTSCASKAKVSLIGDSHLKENKMINDSFDVVPKKPEEFPHVKVVRKKSEKDKLQGFSCKECYEYYKDLSLSETELKCRMQVCSRHKAKYQPPATPEHFWSLSIPDMAEDDDPAEGNLEPLGVYKGPRRRRRLEKRFKSKNEEEM